MFRWCKGPTNDDALPITHAAIHVKFGEEVEIMVKWHKL